MRLAFPRRSMCVPSQGSGRRAPRARQYRNKFLHQKAACKYCSLQTHLPPAAKQACSHWGADSSARRPLCSTGGTCHRSDRRARSSAFPRGKRSYRGRILCVCPCIAGSSFGRHRLFCRYATPFDPETQTTGTGTPFVSVKEATLTPRRFVSSPLVCTLHHCACMDTPRNNENRSGKRERIPRILAGDCTKKRC